jgi:hypothetical protein
MSFSSLGADLVLEWCSVKGTGTRHSFDGACRVVLGETVKSARVLHELELCGHIEVDWVRTGRWSINPPVVSQIEGGGGNAVLIGARSQSTISTLVQLEAAGEIASLTQLTQGPASPTAAFIAASSSAALAAAATAIGATFKTTVRLEYKNALLTLEDAVSGGSSPFTSSGIQAKRFNVSTLRFEPIEVRFGGWKPGCYEQMSHGLRRYLFVDEEGKLHNIDRWLATHAEIRRARESGLSVAVPLAWSPKNESLLCDSRAQLPIMWARAAVMCNGLLPIRRVTSDGHYLDEYRGVLGATYTRIRDTLRYPTKEADVTKVISDANS